MNPSDFYTLLHSIQSSEIEVCHQGQAEYANDPDNIFANFDRISTQLGLTREQVLLVYALKHWDGIVSYVNGHRSQREDIRGRIKDLRMYLALLCGMVDDSYYSELEESAEKHGGKVSYLDAKVEEGRESDDRLLAHIQDEEIQAAEQREKNRLSEFEVVCPVCRYSSITSSTGVFEDTVQNCVGVCPSCGFRGKDYCSDCGNLYTDISCGPTHAMIAQELKIKGGLKEHECDPSKGCGVEQKPEEIVNISKILSIDQDGLAGKLRVLAGIEDFSVCFDALTSRKLLRFQVDQSTWFYATIMGLNRRLESETLLLDLIAKGRMDTLISGSSKGEGVEYTSRYRDDCIGEETGRPTWGYGSEEEKS